MKSWTIGLVLILVVGVLAGCGGGETTSDSADESSSETYTSAALDMSYDGALAASSQLVLGTLKLEETANAVTPEQAATLLPLWQALQGGVTAQAEVNAGMPEGGGPGGGPFGDMSEEERANMRATMEAGGMPEGGRPGGGPFGDMSEEERANVRATMEAGGMPEGGPGGGAFGDMSEEERASMRATMEASGGGMPGRPAGGGAGGRQFGPLMTPLIELLTERAAE
jgi:hypothetical protein